MRRLLALGATLTAAAPALAAVPDGELVMLDIYNWDTVTDKVEPSNERLSWREIIDAGINGVHFRPWHWAHDGDYHYDDLVAEAHEYGLWVGGGSAYGPNWGWNDTLAVTGQVAAAGTDFIQIDEPMGHGFTSAEYDAVKAAAHAENPDCPVLITDVFYNDTVATFPGCDGLVQEVYVDQWYPSSLDQAEAYQASHPNQDVLMWVWLIDRHPVPDPCEIYPDDKFDTWFNASFDRFGKVILFIFSYRTIADPCDGWSSDWDDRVPTIRAATAGLRVPLPEWSGFLPDAPAHTGSPDCAVHVRSEGAGLDPTTVRAHYSTDAGESWTEWNDVECTGAVGTTGWETITAHGVPFENVSSTDNLVRFQIRDTYSGTYYRNARTDKMTFAVDIAELGSGDDDSGDDDAGDDDAGDDDGADDDASDDDGTPAQPPGFDEGCQCTVSDRPPRGAPTATLLLGVWLILRAGRTRAALR